MKRSQKTGVGACILMAAVLVTLIQTAFSQPRSVAEIALYQGPDREKLLVEGAKKEGQLIYYNTNTWLNDVVTKEFEKKYPFIKVSAWRSQSQELLKRVMEEFAARRYLVDVIQASSPTIKVLEKEGGYQEFYSPETAYFDDDTKSKGKRGIYYLADGELYFSLGFNTKLVLPSEAPKTWKDLLDPRWKGKMTLAGGAIGPRWIGNALDVMGRDYLEKISQQEVRLQNISAAALATLIVSGEVPICPCAGYSTINQAKRKGAPVDWNPIEPVTVTTLSSGLSSKAPHPHAALLFLDYVHSKEGQKWVMQGELAPPREDIGFLEKKFKKNYLETKYSVEEYEKKFDEWEQLQGQLFMKRR